MQAVIVLPALADASGLTSWERRLFRPVAGVPLLVRVLATAVASGIHSVLIVQPGSVPDGWVAARVRTRLTRAMPIEVITAEAPVDPSGALNRDRLAPHLKPSFLWVPWNYVTIKRSFAAIVSLAPQGDLATIGTAQTPLVVTSALPAPQAASRGGDLREPVRPPVPPGPLGLLVDSDGSRREAERLLVRGSGKATDGIYSTFNRRLVRPLVRWLSHTPVTANMVTLAAVPLTVVSGYWYAQGYWAAYVAGALLYFFTVLLDEVDGMIARLKFQDSAFGCWLETVTDYASYLFLWVGMGVGLSRQFGTPIWLGLGALTIVMSLLIFVVLVKLRQVATDPNRPEQFNRKIEGSLEADAANPISFSIRKVAFLAKKGVMAHYVVLFTVLGILPVFFALAAFGSVLTFAIVLYTRRLFPRSAYASPPAPATT